MNYNDNKGTKFDDGKVRLDLLPTDALKEIARVLMHGSDKYGDYNWLKGLSYSRVYASLLRHITSWWEGEDKDYESGLSTLAHVGCCCLFLLTYQLRGMTDLDDRPKLKENINDDENKNMMLLSEGNCKQTLLFDYDDIING